MPLTDLIKTSLTTEADESSGVTKSIPPSEGQVVSITSSLAANKTTQRGRRSHEGGYTEARGKGTTVRGYNKANVKMWSGKVGGGSLSTKERRRGKKRVIRGNVQEIVAIFYGNKGKLCTTNWCSEMPLSIFINHWTSLTHLFPDSIFRKIYSLNKIGSYRLLTHTCGDHRIFLQLPFLF